jgi:hypothetical protein
MGIERNNRVNAVNRCAKKWVVFFGSRYYDIQGQQIKTRRNLCVRNVRI